MEIVRNSLAFRLILEEAGFYWAQLFNVRPLVLIVRPRCRLMSDAHMCKGAILRLALTEKLVKVSKQGFNHLFSCSAL